MQPIVPGLSLIDTLLRGAPGITGTVLVEGPQPAVVDVGPQTSSSVLLAALREAGLGPDDLAWIVLTHIHLDHCGATGAIAAAFPRARVVVHRRGARHLVDPARLITGSHAVYGIRAPLYGGLDPVPEDRIDVAPDGHRVPIGPGRDLVMVEAPGHARHQMAVLDEGTGTLMAADALGVQLPRAGLYPTLPPSDVDVEAGLATLARLSETAPSVVCVGHFGAVPDPDEAFGTSEEQWRRSGEAAESGWRRDGLAGVSRALREWLPPEECIRDPDAIATLEWLGWIEANADGLAAWAEARAAAPAE